jgi:hypothetical protein
MTTEIKVNSSQGVATTETVEWKDPYTDPPPRGVNLDVLTWGGVKTDAHWVEDSHLHFAAWCGKPSKPEWLKKRLRDHYSGAFIPSPIQSL